MKTKNIIIIAVVIIIFIAIIYFYARSMKKPATAADKAAFIKECEDKRKTIRVNPGVVLESCESLWNKTQA